jgi:hypothetical protein
MFLIICVCFPLIAFFFVVAILQLSLSRFEKSMKLYPVAGVPEMKERAEREMAAARRKAHAKATGTDSPSPSPRSNSGLSNVRSHTPEQAAIVKKIMSVAKKGHYEVLGIRKPSSEDEIKKAYRKVLCELERLVCSISKYNITSQMHPPPFLCPNTHICSSH